jgi:hypothetical protein
MRLFARGANAAEADRFLEAPPLGICSPEPSRSMLVRPMVGAWSVCLRLWEWEDWLEGANPFWLDEELASMAMATPTEGDYALRWPLSIRRRSYGAWRGFNVAY